MELNEIISLAKERRGLDAESAIRLFGSDETLDFAEKLRRDSFSSATTISAPLDPTPEDIPEKLKYRAEKLAGVGHRRVLLTLNKEAAEAASTAVDTLLSIDRKKDDIRRVDVYLPDGAGEDILAELKDSDAAAVIFNADSDYSLLAGSVGLEDVGLAIRFTQDECLLQLEVLLRRAEEISPRLMLIFRDESLPPEIFERICRTLRAAEPFCPLIIDSSEDPSLTKYATGYILAPSEPLDRLVNRMIRAKELPSFCSACRCEGRTGETFRDDCRSGKLHNFCYLNALISLKEYLTDFGSQDTRIVGTDMILRELYSIKNDDVRALMVKTMKDIRSGERNLRV